MNKIERFGRKINRQRTNPKIWDYPYLLLKNNLKVFKQFRELTDSQNEMLRVLDIGCGFKPWNKLFDREKTEYIGVDSDRERSSADFIAAADRLPFEDNYFDALIYSEVLEHTSNLQDVLGEMHRVAKNNALVYISSPFVFPEHGIPCDYQRLTRYYYQEAFKNDEIIVVKESNSSLSTVVSTLNLFIESTPFSLIPLKYIIYHCCPNVNPVNSTGYSHRHLKPWGQSLRVLAGAGFSRKASHSKSVESSRGFVPVSVVS